MFNFIRAYVASFMKRADERAYNREIYRAARYWSRQGSVSPYAQAAVEMALRMKLEECRSYVCRRYLEDTTQQVEVLKGEWIAANISPMLASSFCREDGVTLLAAVQGMGEEVFFGAAARARRNEIDAAVAKAKAEAPEIAKRQRNRALSIA